jgi:hypothetical protein
MKEKGRMQEKTSVTQGNEGGSRAEEKEPQLAMCL